VVTTFLNVFNNAADAACAMPITINILIKNNVTNLFRVIMYSSFFSYCDNSVNKEQRELFKGFAV